MPPRPFYRQLTMGSLLSLVLMTEETTKECMHVEHKGLFY